MEQFLEYEDIFGTMDIEALKSAAKEFFELAVKIRKKLRKQGYLLDRYISMLFLGMSKTPMYVSGSDGFNIAFELREICDSVMKGRTGHEGHPLYKTVKEYINSHPLDCQEQATRREMYSIALSDCFLEYAAAEYYRRQKGEQMAAFDIFCLRDLYKQISEITGEKHMKRLNLLMRERFLFVTPMEGFLQGLTHDLLCALTSRDAETSKLTLQLYLEQNK